MYGHSREVFFFEKIESDLTQRICVKLGPCTTLVACAWCAFVARSVPRKKRTRQRFDSKKCPKTWFVFFVSDFANVKLCCFQVKKYHCSGSRWQIWENNDEVCWFSEIPSTFSFVLWKWPLASVRFSETKKLTDSDVKTQKKRRKKTKRIKVDKRHLFCSFYTHFYILL